jgi:hypothetical protein
MSDRQLRTNDRRRTRVRAGLFDKVLGDANPVIRYGFAALLFFGPLYLAATYGMKEAGVIAACAFLGIVVYRQRTAGTLSFG